MISHIANLHFCPTIQSVQNLNEEGIVENIFLVGNTIVDSFELILDNPVLSEHIVNLVNKVEEYYLVTLHRRENRKGNFDDIWLF